MTRVDNKSGSHPPAPRSHNAYPGGDHGPGEFHQVRAPAPGQLAQQLGSRVAPTCCVEIRAKEPGEEAGACQMDLICAPQLMSAKAGWPDQKEAALRAFFRCFCVTQRDARVVARTF